MSVSGRPRALLPFGVELLFVRCFVLLSALNQSYHIFLKSAVAQHAMDSLGRISKFILQHKGSEANSAVVAEAGGRISCNAFLLHYNGLLIVL